MFAFGEYNSSDLLWLGDWSPRWILLLSIVGLAVLLFSAYDLKDLKPLRRATLIGLRGLVYGLAVLLLLEPALDLRQISKVQNHVAVLVDTSQTMELGADESETTRYERVLSALRELSPTFDHLSADHHFDFYLYGDALELTSLAALSQLTPRARSADLTAALEQVREEYAGRDLGGVIVLSDGIDTGGIGRRVQRGEDLDQLSRELLESLNAPIHTLAAASDQGIRDAAITRVLHDDFAFVHNSISVDVELQFIGLQTQSVPVTLRRDGEVIQTERIQIHPQETLYEVSFEFVPRQIGKEVYTVDVPEFEDEALYENNQHHFVLRVIRDRIRVLQVVGRPSWDQRFLRRLLKRNPNVELISFFILRTDGNPNLVPTSEMSLIPFPTEELFRDELGSFDLVIFQNFNFGPYHMGRFLQNISDYVHDGGAFAMIGGDLSFASGGYARTPVESLLPVQLPTGSARSDLMDSQSFRPSLTEAGHRHPITQLAFDPEHNRQLWNELPPLQGTNIVLGPTEDATVLATHPTLRYQGEPMPVIAIGERGEGRVMAMTSDSSWRWGFEHVGEGGTQREYQHFWNNAIRWLIQDPELKLVRLDINEDIISPDVPLDATVRVFDADYSAAVGASGEIQVYFTALDRISRGTEAGRQHYDTFEFTTDHSGQWHLDYLFEEPGVYELEVEVTTAAGELRDQNLILVVPEVSQFRDIVPRNRLLKEISNATMGHHYLLPELHPRNLRFQEPRFVEVHQREVVQLWDNLFLFLLILGLLGSEWTLRRRWGRI